MTKTDRVLTHLKENGSITSIEAFTLYGATRLSAIIFNLKDKGYEIESVWEESADRYGDNCRYVRYFLK